MNQQAIGILGGTFDPIHYGHLRLALELQEAFNLAKIHFIPCHSPVHRQAQPIASAAQRLTMVELAIQGQHHFVVDDREIKRQKPSYTIETLEEFRAQLETEIPLCLLMGMDAFLGFNTWHQADRILDLAHLIIAPRPDFQLPRQGLLADLLQKHLQQDRAFLHQQSAGGIFIQSTTELAISASAIRKQIAMGKNPRYLLPDKVYNYIKEHSIYEMAKGMDLN